jgi:hypothetical protein
MHEQQMEKALKKVQDLQTIKEGVVQNSTDEEKHSFVQGLLVVRAERDKRMKKVQAKMDDDTILERTLPDTDEGLLKVTREFSIESKEFLDFIMLSERQEISCNLLIGLYMRVLELSLPTNRRLLTYPLFLERAEELDRRDVYGMYLLLSHSFVCLILVNHQ